MDKVWIVIQNYPYDSDEILGVYGDECSARCHMHTEHANKKYVYTRIEEHEVREWEGGQ